MLTNIGIIKKLFWRVARAVEWGGLENRCFRTENPGFESLTLRHFSINELSYWLKYSCILR